MKNKLLTLLLSLAISFGLWLYVVTVISPESEATYYKIPVELVGTESLTDRGLIIVSDAKNVKMNLTLSGNRSDLNKLSSSNITIIADLSKIKTAGKHQVDCTVSFQSGTAEVVAQEPEQITVEVVKQETKNVPVIVSYPGSLPEGYEVDKLASYFSRTSVEVKGPKEAIDQVDHVGITVTLSDQMLSFPIECPLTLYGADSQPLRNTQYITTDVSTISGVVKVNKVKEITVYFELDYTDSGLSEESGGMVTVHPMKVTLLGTDETLAKVDSSHTFTIRLSDYKETTEATFLLPLPDGVTCKDEIKVQIPIPDMGTKTLKLDSSFFKLMNVSGEVNIQVVGTPTVEIYGPTDVLEELNFDQIMIVMDCTQVKKVEDLSSATYLLKYLVGGKNYDYLRIRVTWDKGDISVNGVEK